MAAVLFISFSFAKVVTSFIEDKNEELDGRDCAVFSHLTNTFVPKPCDRKYEWICKMNKGKTTNINRILQAVEQLYVIIWFIYFR